MQHQVSIDSSIKVCGVNVYSGRKSSATFHPAMEDSGLVFLVKGKRIPAKLEFAKHSLLAIALDNGERTARLVEHLLSAVYALGIDNLEIELSDGVCPTVDNCAREYFDALKDGRLDQGSPKKYWRYVGDEFTVRCPHNRKPDLLKVSTAEISTLHYDAYYPHKVIGWQSYEFDFSEKNYCRDVADARPPGFIWNGLFKKTLFTINHTVGIPGVNDRNYLLITSKNASEVANSEGFQTRYGGDEFVRHKVLDVLGTLALTGRSFYKTRFDFNMTGHRFDLYSLNQLFESGSVIEHVNDSRHTS